MVESNNQLAIETVKKMLHRYVQGAIDIDCQLTRYDRMYVQFGSISAVRYSDMPKAPSPVMDRKAIFIEKMMDLSAVIDKKIAKQKEREKEINNILEQLDNSLEREVIRSRYLDINTPGQVEKKAWGDVVEEVFGGRDDYMRKHDSYVKKTFKLHKAAIEDMSRYV